MKNIKKKELIKQNKILLQKNDTLLVELLRVLKRLSDSDIITKEELMLYKVRSVDKLYGG